MSNAYDENDADRKTKIPPTDDAEQQGGEKTEGASETDTGTGAEDKQQ